MFELAPARPARIYHDDLAERQTDIAVLRHKARTARIRINTYIPDKKVNDEFL